MADNLQFPILFDLEKGVEAAIKEWDGKYADKLEKAIQKRALNVKLKFDTTQLDSLDAVKTRLAQLKIEPITPETKSAIKELASELRTLAKALEQVQKYAKNPTKGAIDASKVQLNEQRAKAQAALAAQRAAKAEDNLAAARLKAARAANVGTSATRNANKAFAEQSSYLSRLIQRMAAYWSIRQVGNFITSIREVTAQFELQRVSLGAIIQDQARANELFSEIKSFALKSPVSILDLTKYTKQLAAYKVGWDGVKTDTKELFDWTKKLTDVSVGLGVSMDRVVLAFGQVRATGYLRASEVRQFTEMGVPIVEELAAKLSKLNGEAVTAADVMDMISERGISFEMVKDVFDDMTSAGGMFYNMQEKQGNTLYGLWAKLGDAASVMYDQIGNTGIVNKGMKAGIQALTDLMRNWQQASRMIAFAGAATLVYITRQKILKLETAKVAAIQETYNARMARTHILLSSSSRLTRAHGFALGVQARMLKMASTAAAAFGTSLTAIKSAIISTGWGALILALGYVADKLLFAKTNAERAAEAISKISEETATETAKSVRNFEYLANKAVNAPKGSKEQKEALEELNRTYSDILPKELLELEYLDKLNGRYGSLTNTIREYIAEQQRRKALDEITNVYGAEKQKYERELNNHFREQGWTEGEIARFWEKFYDVAKDKSKGLQQVVTESVISAGRDGFEDVFKLLQHQGWRSKVDKYTYNKIGLATFGRWLGGGMDNIDLLRDVVLEENQAIEQSIERHKAAATTTNEFADAQERAAQKIKKVRFVDFKGEAIGTDTYIGKQALKNFELKELTKILKDGFTKAELTWDQECGNFIAHINEKTPQLVTTINFDILSDKITKALDNEQLSEAKRTYLENLFDFVQQSKQRYDELVPSNPTVAAFQNKLAAIATAAGANLNDLSQYFMQSGEKIEDYAKRIGDAIKDLELRVQEMQQVNEMHRNGTGWALQGYSEEQIKEIQIRVAVLKELFPLLQGFTKTSGGGTKSDNRLQNLQEIEQTLTKINQKYDELAKKEGQTKALEDINNLYANTLQYVNKLGKQFKLSFKMPTEFKDLQDYRKAILDVINTLKMKGYQKAALDLEEKIGTGNLDALQKDIEKQLKELSDRISRSKTAKEFYEKILGMTGDVELAANVAVHVYGEQGKDLNKQIREQIEKLLEPSGIKIDESIFREDGTFDPKKLREFAEAQKDALGGIESKAYQELIKLSDNADKDFAKTIEGWLKAIEKAKSASDKMLDLARTTRTEIDKITAQKGYAQTRITELLGLGTRTDEQQQELENLQGFLDVADKLIQGFKDKQTKEQTSLAYEMFKDSPMYVQMFDDLDHASTAMLENMKTRIEGLKGAWKDLTPTQLKELQSRMNEIDAQLAKRNPFKTLAKSISDYSKLRREGDSRGNKSEGAANADLIAASKAADEARKKYDELVKKYGEGSEKSVQEVIDAKDKLDRAMANEEAAQKAVENWKKVKDMIGLSANELFQMLNWAGDIAKGIADISEAMGADEEDVQYWNDIASALNEVTAGIEDIVKSAMNGNVVGIISSVLTAVPKMFVGFVNLFSAGKIKRANKEIKRQQELLDQLEYTYGRLEKAADKVFGHEYLNNYNQQLKILQAQQQAYLKQAEAERSKGKKKDEDKIKEYENQARDTADKIMELQDDLVAHFTGSTKTDAARQMAKSWIDARASMSDTFAAIKGDYQDLIKNMIVEGAAARVIENALTPVWDSMQKMLDKNDVQGAIDSLIGGMDSALNAANNGMEVLWKALEARGYDMKSLISNTDSEFSGIAKNVAGATSEEINNVAAIGNTLMYYVSPIPRMDENLARIRAIMENGAAATATTSAASTGWTDWQQQAMDNYTAIQRNTADTVVECRRAANACEKFAKAIVQKGATAGLNVFLKN